MLLITEASGGLIACLDTVNVYRSQEHDIDAAGIREIAFLMMSILFALISVLWSLNRVRVARTYNKAALATTRTFQVRPSCNKSI